jgi:hypothetical protein
MTITGKSVDFTAARDGVQINLAVAPTETDPAFLLGIPLTPDEAAQMGGLLLALAGACKANSSSIISARGLHVAPSNGST